MIENPVFIVGTERSGSNLLRLLLNELPSLAIPHPPHLMRDLTPHLVKFGNLDDDANFWRLIDSAIQLVELHFAPWPITLERSKIFCECSTRDLYSVYAAIYEQYRQHQGKSRWGCKSTFMIHHVQDILRHHSRPQFIHLLRDPRDVAVSARRSVFCHYHPYFVADLWTREQAAGVEWSEKLPSSTWLTLRYEDLIDDPQKQMRGICEFLGVQYEEKFLQYFNGPSARQLSRLSRSWENVGKPIIAANSQKFRTALSAREVQIIESVAGETMAEFGYDRVSAKDLKPSSAEIAMFHCIENWRMVKEEGQAFLWDKNAKSRWRKKMHLTLRLPVEHARASCRRWIAVPRA